MQYSTAKAAIMGFTKTLAIEGHKYNILANVIAPSAGTAMTSTIWPQEMVDAFKVCYVPDYHNMTTDAMLSQPDFIAPLVGYLTSAENEETTGSLFEVVGGWAAETRWQRSGGYGFPVKQPFTPESIISKWEQITSFSELLSSV